MGMTPLIVISLAAYDLLQIRGGSTQTKGKGYSCPFAKTLYDTHAHLEVPNKDFTASAFLSISK